MIIQWQPGTKLAEIEREIIEGAYRFYGHNKAKTADALGVSIRTLDNKFKKYKSQDAVLREQKKRESKQFNDELESKRFKESENQAEVEHILPRSKQK